jgi:anti-anti-sigma factor
MTVTTSKHAARPLPDLVVSVAIEGPATVVGLRGEADMATLPMVRETFKRVVRDHHGPVVVELADTRFIDSGTVRVMRQAGDALEQQSRRLTIRSPSKVASVVLEMFGLSQLVMSPAMAAPDYSAAPSGQ